jgi:CBS domain-containing protein
MPMKVSSRNVGKYPEVQGRMSSTRNERQTRGHRNKASAGDIAPPPRRIGELMTTHVVQLQPHKLFREAVDLLAKNPFRHLLVGDPDGRILGVISDRDVLRAADCYDSETTLAADVMTPEPITVHVDTPLSSAVALVLDHQVNCLPVVDADGLIQGIITTTDLLKAFQNLQLRIEKTPE